ncbi:metal ABC transporter solute-binding protein, Zn/Mn family [Salibacterium aidingense]|uniref:metal ABC transporter solute-binding protein, Zn/Mn family n=1 Tax=Salibacterium aidingense TaxID=384933 RepID=UPI003BD6CDDB
MKSQLRFILPGILLVLVISACSSEEADENEESADNTEEPLKVYTTLFAWEDFANKIGGEEVEVENIIPAGADAHSFEPTSQTMIDIAESDLFMMNGAGMEGFAESLNETLEEEGVSSLEVTNGIDLIDFHEEHTHSHDHTDEHDHDHDHSHGDVDPHVWLDPVRSKEAVDNIKDKLIELRPEQEEYFEGNAEEVKNKLTALDEKFSEMADTAENHQFIVSHAAYGYWEDRYDLEQISVSGLSPSDEPSQQELEGIIETVEDTGINHVMFEQNVASKVTEVIQDEVGAEALQLHNLSVRVEEEIENQEDYFDLMQQNIEQLSIALAVEGHAAKGSNGKDGGTPDIVVKGAKDHYHSGDNIELTYSIQGETESDHVDWLEKSPEEEEAEVVDGEETYTAAASKDLDGTEVSAALYDDDHNIIAQTEPIVIHIDDHENGDDHNH